ncbi:HTH domain-containing protein, partial [Paractinoplanes durhamensis]
NVSTLDEKPVRGHLQPSWLERLYTLFAGAAGGITVNQLSDDFGYRGLSVALLVSSISASAVWLRRLPQRAPLIRYVQLALFCVAAMGAFLSPLPPLSASRLPVLISVAALILTALVSANLFQASRILLGAATAGVAAGALQFGVLSFVRQDWHVGFNATCVGLFALCAFFGMGFNDNQLRRLALLSLAAYGLVWTVVHLLSNHPHLILLDMATTYVALHFNRRLPKRNITYCSVAPGVMLAVEISTPDRTIPEWARRRLDMNAVKALVIASMGLAIGVGSLAAGYYLVGTAMTVGGVGSLLRGLHYLRYGIFLERLRNRLSVLRDEPSRAALHELPAVSVPLPDVAEALKAKRTATARELAELTGLSRSAVLNQLRTLTAAGDTVPIGAAQSPKRLYKWVSHVPGPR